MFYIKDQCNTNVCCKKKLKNERYFQKRRLTCHRAVGVGENPFHMKKKNASNLFKDMVE